MWHHAILASTLLLPATLALQIDSHLATSTTLLCSTIYDTSSLSGSIPTTTVSLQQTLDLSPVILHNYTSVTSTVTPKPFSTLFSVLATKTKTTEAEAINGTFYITETRFGTSTVWEHATTTKTETKTRLMTSRTTEWIDAFTGFVGVRNNTISTAVSSASSVTKQKRNAAAQHPDSKRQNTSQKPKLVRPTQGKYAVGVGCQQLVGIHTTEVLLLTAKKTATVTLRPETVYKNRTVYGTITSTILVSSVSGSSSSTSLSSSTAPPSSTNTQNKRDQDATPLTPIPSKRSLASIAMALISPSPLASTSSPTSISTNTTTVTKTPYTISFTWTRTITTTSTTTLHATTTLTSYSACATSNLLSQTSNNKRINGVSLPFPSQDQETSLESLITETAAKCCENCVGRGKNCLWSIWQAEGQKSGSCYLTLLVTNPSPQQQTRNLQTKREKEIEAEAEEEQQCPSQSQKAIFGYSGRNGEVRYVVSNGLCGFLSEA